MSLFYVPVDLSHTALLVADVQEQILSRFSTDLQERYCATVLSLIETFRKEISTRRERQTSGSDGAYEGIPLIAHHVFPPGINGNGFISPYNKLARWMKQLEAKGFFPKTATDPNKPQYAIPNSLVPKSGWGTKDEIIVPKLSAGCFSSSDLLAYLRARGIRHVVLCGLTTSGSILGSARLGADLDFHIVIPKECVMDDESETSDFLLEKVLPKFVDVVTVNDVKNLFE
jgi:nicotinamidase-related amidase